MKNNWLVILSISVAFLFLTGFSSEDSYKKAMWVERTEINDHGAAIIKEAQEKKINTLYVNVNPDTPDASYQHFNEQAQQVGISVYAAGGEPDWALEANQSELIDFVIWAKNFQASAGEGQQFAGIHLRIQPQYLNEWYNDPFEVVEQWKTNIEAAVTEAGSLKTTGVIPFWLDTTQTPGDPDLPFNEWMIEQFDETTILAYRDTLEGENGIVSLTENEFEAADRLEKKLMIGVTIAETGSNHTTFFEEGQEDMEMHLGVADRHLGEHPSYAGTLVNGFQAPEPEESVVPEKEEIRGTYIWHAPDLIEKQDEILTFAKEQNLNLLYTRLDLRKPFTAYADFVEKANAAGIEVHAMGGHPSWAKKESEGRILNLVDYVKSYNESSGSGQQFAGIHLDVEPYTDPSWDTNEQDVLRQWMDNLEVFVEETKRGSDLEASMDLAMWFDDLPTPDHPDTPFYQWVIDTMDHTSVMAFRDQAKGPGGILDVAANELSYAEEVGKKMLISVEMKESKANPHISFYEEGAVIMEDMLTIVNEELESNASYNGSVVHSYRYWRNAQP
ncbi:hypothetical protein LCM20_12415 [Halobacillus litoralis]|uniref:hypothetical protein n=1 Tax=Halobacillus litoralis TaxID=45668 RepID=UPI001CD2E98F|nr:hypothetical protein [Halobacillus litoralis]MCA0971400.1 hypothetical protein [Halobacillus litoralis]